jgi:hypothetical protein
MLDIQIDIEKSITRRWLTYRTTIWNVISLIADYVSGLVTMVVVPFLLGLLAAVTGGIIGAAILAIAAISIGYWILSFFFLNRLVIVQGSTTDENRQRIMLLVGEKFPGYKLETGQNIILASHRYRYFAFHRTIVIILDGGDVYINAFTLGRGNIKYLTAALPNYLLSRKLAGEFSNMI